MEDDVTGPEFVQPRTRHDAVITLAEPDPHWAQEYAALAASIRRAVGGAVVRLEHVGSTSVPGLVAKPIIDILLVVKDPANEASYVPALEQVGFLLHLREPAWHGHRLLRHDRPAANLHVFAGGTQEPERMLRFRDRLRSHPEDAETYARTKRELAARTWTYVQDYADAKSVVVESILARAAP